MDIHDISNKFDALLSDQKKTLKQMDKLILLAEQLLNDVKEKTQCIQ
jgi:hypothetical protein